MSEHEAIAATVRAACLQAALEAYEDAGVRGLCAEGRWERAVEAIRDLGAGPEVSLQGDLEPAGQVRTVRHFLAALAYRFVKAVRDAPPGFPDFAAGHGVRTPHAVVHHVNGVLGYAAVAVAGGDVRYRHPHPRLDWDGEIALVHATLARLDALLVERPPGDPERLHRLLQGPLSDAMTHVGQLATLRRLAGDPIPGENFFEADVRVGRVGSDQAPSVSPDDPSPEGGR